MIESPADDPAEEQVGGRLHQPLPLHHTLPVAGIGALAGIGSSTDAFAFLHPEGLHPVFLSVSCHAHYTDAGDLALRIEAEEKAGRIAARKVKLYQVECLLPNRAA
jgi:hypothetical protein